LCAVLAGQPKRLAPEEDVENSQVPKKAKHAASAPASGYASLAACPICMQMQQIEFCWSLLCPCTTSSHARFGQCSADVKKRAVSASPAKAPVKKSPAKAKSTAKKPAQSTKPQEKTGKKGNEQASDSDFEVRRKWLLLRTICKVAKDQFRKLQTLRHMAM
jgi:hypothetical protein